MRTPSFYVYKMYTVHHDATLLPALLNTEVYEFAGREVPALSVSASKTSDGIIHISIANLNPGKEIPLECDIRGQAIQNVSAEILTADEINAFNDFGDKESVVPKEFRDFKMKDPGILVNVPSKSVVVLKIK